MIDNSPYSKEHCEFIRYQTRRQFDKVRMTWIECGKWALPHRIKWMVSQTQGERNNQHIVDPTHILALRSYVAGFLEGNTSASRPWYRLSHQDPELASFPAHKEWLDHLTRRTLTALANSNFYYAAGGFYYDFGVFNTGAHYIDELNNGLHFHNLEPGAYYCLNNELGVADVLVREYCLTVKVLVETYGTKKNGSWDWSNISSRVRKLYEDGVYGDRIDVCHVILPNKLFDANQPVAALNKQYISLTYEMGTSHGEFYATSGAMGLEEMPSNSTEQDKFLKVSASKRKPFIVGKADSNNNFEYGEKGPTLDALGLIKSLNKKAIGKDIALDQMLKPTVQGPASLKKSYVTLQSNAFIPLDANSAAQGGLKPVFQINPAIAALNQDVQDLRNQVEKLYYSDYLLYLSRNPKTRTATETNAVIQEQQLIIGPNLQSLNWTYNNPVVDFVTDYVLNEDPYLKPIPEALQGEFLRPEFISVFAQAQKAADLPAIDRYREMVQAVGQIQPAILDKINLDKLADLYEDRLYLPAGLNNPQSKVDMARQQAQAMAQKQQMLHETLPAIAGAAKDVSALVKK